MWILITCIFLNAFIGVIFKLFDKYKVDNFQAIVVNYLVCVLTAFIVAEGKPFQEHIFSQSWFWYALSLGCIFIVAFNLMAFTIQHFGLTVASVFQKMALIAPTLIAILIYGESSNTLKWVGIFTSIIAILLLSYGGKDDKVVTHKKRHIWIFPILTFLSSCIIDSVFFLVGHQNMSQYGDLGFITLLFLSAGFCGLILLILQLLRRKTQVTFRNILGGIILGVPNFFSIYLLLLLLKQGWEGSVVFPINNVGILIVAAIFGLFIFGERLSKVKMTGFILAILTILFISLA
ncbi:MAG: EamA family transporter [Saprospiraceae bacterium]|nr:EamA family transporter [Saprospiraceae bacterium]